MMQPVDFARHNEEVRQVWEAYHAGRPLRVPFGPLGINPRIWVFRPPPEHRRHHLAAVQQRS